MASNFEVATGYWDNYSNEGWFISSLTLDVQTGSLLIAGTATFITLVGSRFWAIISFVIHQFRSTGTEHDGIHHQQQVVYKNTTQLGAVWLLTQIAWAWRGVASRNLSRYIGFSLPPLICFVAFTFASIISSRIAAPTYAASEVRLVPINCGFLSPKDAGPNDPTVGMLQVARHSSWSNIKAKEAIDYARACYGQSGSAACRTFPARELPYTTRDAECPFKMGRCALGEDGQQTAFELTTDWLDSNVHLGINAPKQDRIRYRKQATCSTINTEGLISKTGPFEMETFFYNLGTVGPPVDGVATYNYTFRTVQTDKQAKTYSVQTRYSMAQDPEGILGWQPIEDLNRTDADVSIIFLQSNNVRYPNPVSDPLFHANSSFQSTVNYIGYSSNHPGRILACTDQFQFQDPTTNATTELTGLLEAQIQSETLGLTPTQTWTLDRLRMARGRSLMSGSIGGLGPSSLRASDVNAGSLSQGLPDGQWRIEVMGWFNASLASLQEHVVGFASKNMNNMEDIFGLDLPPRMVSMCEQQMILNVGKYQTFSVLGLGVVFAVGSFIILLSWVMEPIMRWIQARYGGKEKQHHWRLASALQLQRVGFLKDGLGGEWEYGGEVPVSQGNETWPAPIDGGITYEQVRPKH